MVWGPIPFALVHFGCFLVEEGEAYPYATKVENRGDCVVPPSKSAKMGVLVGHGQNVLLYSRKNLSLIGSTRKFCLRKRGNSYWRGYCLESITDDTFGFVLKDFITDFPERLLVFSTEN